MEYLIADIGNTETKFCILNKKFKIIKRLKISTLKIYDNFFLKKKFLTFIGRKTKIKKALFSSVVPQAFIGIKKNLNKYFKIKSKKLEKNNYSKLITIKVNKNQIGSDRIANAIGSFKKYKCNCIVLDFGTATTFDVVEKGSYKGGVIAPGVSISLNTLIKKANLIPSITLKKINKVVGNNTVTALRSGFFWGYIGLIENILLLIKKQTNKKYKIILTGGFSSLFKNAIKYKVFINKDITMNGLIEIFKSEKDLS